MTDIWIVPTTTTPAAHTGMCEHREFDSATKVHRQINDGGGVTWSAEFEVWCRQCGVKFLFPVAGGQPAALTGIVPPPGAGLQAAPPVRRPCPQHGDNCPNQPR